MTILTAKDIKDLPERDRASFVNCLSGVKSANLLGTVNSSGQENLAIFSSVFHLGANPALMGFISRPHSTPRHTLENFREVGFATLNHVNPEIVKMAHQTSARYERNQSEFAATGLTPIYQQGFKAPFVKESTIQIGLSYGRDFLIDENGTVLIVAKIELVIVSEEYIRKDWSVDLVKADSVGVIGLDEYVQLEKLVRLSYAKPDRPSRPLD